MSDSASVGDVRLITRVKVEQIARSYGVRDEADALTVDGLKSRTLGEHLRPPAPPVTMLSWSRRGPVKGQNKSNLGGGMERRQHCLGGKGGNECSHHSSRKCSNFESIYCQPRVFRLDFFVVSARA